MHYKEKKETADSYVGFGAAMWGSELLMWGSEVSFANNGVRRSEMWGSWPPSPPTLPGLLYSAPLAAKLLHSRFTSGVIREGHQT